MEENELQKTHDLLFYNLRAVIKCLRNLELGDYSPLMDEIFDSEAALQKAEDKVRIDKFSRKLYD